MDIFDNLLYIFSALNDFLESGFPQTQTVYVEDDNLYTYFTSNN